VINTDLSEQFLVFSNPDSISREKLLSSRFVVPNVKSGATVGGVALPTSSFWVSSQLPVTNINTYKRECATQQPPVALQSNLGSRTSVFVPFGQEWTVSEMPFSLEQLFSRPLLPSEAIPAAMKSLCNCTATLRSKLVVP
jgi:hypothetical protein